MIKTKLTSILSLKEIYDCYYGFERFQIIFQDFQIANKHELEKIIKEIKDNTEQYKIDTSLMFDIAKEFFKEWNHWIKWVKRTESYRLSGISCQV